MVSTEWSIRSLLNPVVTRLIIYGINPMDLEFVLQKIEASVLINSKSLEKKWISLWEEKAAFYTQLAESAEDKRNKQTAWEMYIKASQCYFAIYLINTSDTELKKNKYMKLVDIYYKAVGLGSNPVRKVEVPLSNGGSIAAFLHLPEPSKAKKCSVVFFAGLGSCKEEMDPMARSLVERGISVLIPDMPGCGETLFNKNMKCTKQNVESAAHACLQFLQADECTNGGKIGSTGLCMGGGYAYNAAVANDGFDFCAVFFPLYIDQVADAHTPQWMKSGDWYDFQTGGVDSVIFRKDMGRNRSQNMSCPLLMIHGKHDNWMTIDDALDLYGSCTSAEKIKMIIEDEPIFSKNESVLHTMPVGEQLHWIRPVFADWISERVDN